MSALQAVLSTSSHSVKTVGAAVEILNLTDNSKTKFKKNHLNTFGLNFGLPKNGGTCPGATSGKGGCLHLKKVGGVNATCYMANVVKAYPGVSNSLQQNTDKLTGKTRKQMAEILAATVDRFINKSKGVDLYFRCFYSGDVFSKDLALALVETFKKYPQVQFWMYTRSHKYVALLSEPKNVAVYLSVDPVNKESGYKVYEELKDRSNVGIAMMGDTEELRDIKFVTCPETSGKVKNTPEAGACSKCRLCFRYKDDFKLRPIRFLIH